MKVYPQALNQDHTFKVLETYQQCQIIFSILLGCRKLPQGIHLGLEGLVAVNESGSDIDVRLTGFAQFNQAAALEKLACTIIL